MEVLKTHIEGLLIINSAVYRDSRGYFFESYNKRDYNHKGLDYRFVQDNESMSSRGVLRGLHYQTAPREQAKIVRVSYGEVLDVAVDIRKGSKTFGEHLSMILSGQNKKQLLIPRGFAHGFLVLSDFAIFNYKCDNYYSKENESGIKYDDPELNIDWGFAKKDIIVSPKDRELPYFRSSKL